MKTDLEHALNMRKIETAFALLVEYMDALRRENHALKKQLEKSYGPKPTIPNRPRR